MSEDREHKELKTILLAKGRELGLEIHPNTKLDNIAEMVNKGLIYQHSGAPDAAVLATEAGTPAEARREAERQIRVRVNALDPKMQGLGSAPFGFANSVVGTIQRVVPLDREVGFHIPVVLIDVIKSKKYRVTKYRLDDKGNEVPYSVELPSYSVEILPDLTPAELDVIAARQIKVEG